MCSSDLAEEMSAVLPADGIPAEQPQADLVHESRRLHGNVAAFPREVAVRHAVQLAVDKWDQPVEGALVAFAPDLKQARDVRACRLLLWRHADSALLVGPGSVPRQCRTGIPRQ